MLSARRARQRLSDPRREGRRNVTSSLADWTNIELLYRVPGEIKRREAELDPQVSPEEIMSREVELGCES